MELYMNVPLTEKILKNSSLLKMWTVKLIHDIIIDRFGHNPITFFAGVL